MSGNRRWALGAGLWVNKQHHNLTLPLPGQPSAGVLCPKAHVPEIVIARNHALGVTRNDVKYHALRTTSFALTRRVSHPLLTSPIKGEGFTPIPRYADTPIPTNFCGPLRSARMGGQRPSALKALVSSRKPKTRFSSVYSVTLW